MNIDRMDFEKSKDLNIIHLDMDAFYAAVEEKDDSILKGHPVIVGGMSKHGIVTTANYEARKFGIHSAMPAFQARAQCPHGIYIKPRMERYRQVSREIFDVLYEYTDRIEKISVDEAYLDIKEIKGHPIKTIKKIKKRVYEEIGLTMSIGLSYNKFLAKLASDWNKPDGITIIDKASLSTMLPPLSIKKVHGIGPKSEKKLNNIGIYNIGDLLQLEENFLIELFGKAGREIYFRIRGEDDREIDTSRERKSIGIERTFEIDTDDKTTLNSYLRDFSNQLSEELIKKKLHSRTIIVKIKDEKFRSQTRSRTLTTHTDDRDQIYEVGCSLLNEIEIDKKIRLLGITGSNLISKDLKQLSLFD